MKEKPIYEELRIMGLLREILAAGFKPDVDGKVELRNVLKREHTWLHTGTKDARQCSLWLQTMFKHFSVLPSGCLGCWKTFYKPQTLSELFEIYEFQQHESRKVVDIPCKCGIETRAFTGNLGGYASFWYNPLGCSIEEARSNTKRLSRALGKELDFKRGCTEMEIWSQRYYGLGSNEWERLRSPMMKIREELLAATFEIVGEAREELPLIQEIDVKQCWIEHAAAHGDQTYLGYCKDPMAIIIPVLKYRRTNHGLVDTESRGSEKAVGNGDEREKLIETLEETE